MTDACSPATSRKRSTSTEEKYVYYRCTGNRGKCDLPRFREADLADRWGEPLKGLQVPPEIVAQIVTSLREVQRQAKGKISAERSRLESRLTAIRHRMDAAYTDKLDVKIAEDFWERKRASGGRKSSRRRWLYGTRRCQTGDRTLDAQRVFELANKAHSLYIFCRTRMKEPNCSECCVRTFL